MDGGIVNTIVLIAGMTVVTYVPRVLPLVLRRGAEIPPWYQRAMRLVPFAAIGALIIPGALTSVAGDAALSGVGLLAAVILATLVRQPFVVVVGSVGAVVLAVSLGM